MLLRSCAACEAFLRAYAVDPTATLAAEFLILDRLFPRSIVRSLSTAEECLAALDPRSGRVGPDDEARRVLGLTRTGLEYRRISELFEDLLGELDALQDACRRAGSALAGRYFRRPTPSNGAWSAVATLWSRLSVGHETHRLSWTGVRRRPESVVNRSLR